MMTFNGVEPPQYPTKVKENPTSIKTDTFAIDGTPSRMQGDSKGRAVLTYESASAATFQFFKALYDAATSVTYYNDENNTGVPITFTGIIDVDEDEYMRGGSLMVPLTVTIMEGNNAGS